MNDPMRIRHRRWGKNFTGYFGAGEGCPYFTAGAAKSVAYYFLNARGT
jgi:hypothetical protein